MEQPDFPDWILSVMRLVEDEREEAARPLFELWYGDFLPRIQAGDLDWASGFIYALDDYLIDESGPLPEKRTWILEEYRAFSEELASRK